MTADPHDRVTELLADFKRLLDTDTLIGSASDYLAHAHDVVDHIHTTGAIPVPVDPFTGAADDIPPPPTDDPRLYYTMFWRMFDRLPVSMVQSFAIPLRRLLAHKIFKHCGDDVTFHHNVLFSTGANLSIGDGSLINRYVMLDDRTDLTIGSHVMVAAGVTIETHTHPFDDFSVPIAQAGRSGRPVSIGDNCVLGYNVVVMAGVTVGYRCIVGANSVVTKDVPDHLVVGGVPAKPIGEYQPPA